MEHRKTVGIVRTYKCPECGYTEDGIDITKTNWNIDMISGEATCPECEYTASMPRE